MASWVVRPVRQVACALAAHDSPRQLAWGVALGMLLGLVPKGNLTALALAIVLFSLRVNLGLGLASAGVFSWIGGFLDPIAHRLGWQILSFGPLQPVYRWVFELPVVPWSDLNNTVVFGQLVLGLYALLPVYWASLLVVRRWHEAVAQRLRKYRVARRLLGLELAARLEVGD